MKRSPALALLVLLLAPVEALANATSLPDTLNPALRPGDTSRLALEANFGFLESVGGAPWTWLCHETFLPSSSSATPIFFEGPGEKLLVTVRALGIANDPTNSLFLSTDGCEWGAPAGLTNVLIRDVAFDPSNPEHLLAASSSGAGSNNGVWVSTNGGLSWGKTILDLPQRFFRTVRFAPNDPLVAYASGTWYMPAGAWIYRSDDGGVTWNEYPWVVQPGGPTGPTLTQLDVMAVSPTNSQVIWVRTDYTTNYLLRSTDGGVSFSNVFNVASPIKSVTYDREAAFVWVSAAEAGTWRTTDGSSFEEITTAPSIRGMAMDSRGLFAAANNYADLMALGVATTGTAFTPLFRFEEISGPKVCPAGSDVQTICEPLWPALAQRLGITPTPTATPTPGGDDDDGCTCGLEARAESRSPARFLALAATLACVFALARRRFDRG